MFMQWSRPVTTAAVYFICCIAHNRALPSLNALGGRYLDRLSVAHNIALTLFSALVFVNAASLLLAEVRLTGWHNFLCAPVQPGAHAALRGDLHRWCYVYYVSKYYELLDTALLIARRKRIILLHALHHGLIPVVMYLLFEGGAPPHHQLSYSSSSPPPTHCRRPTAANPPTRYKVSRPTCLQASQCPWLG